MATSQCADDLPKFDGQVVHMSTWPSALRQAEHRLTDDVAFFVRTGAKCNINGSIASLQSNMRFSCTTISSSSADSV